MMMKKYFERGVKMSLFSLLSAFCISANAQESVSSGTISLTLDKAIEIAVNDNPTITIADKQVELKTISKDEAWQALLPSADFSGTVQYTVLAAVMKLNDMEFKMGKDNTSTWNGQFQISLPVFAPTVYATMNLTKDDLLNAVEQSRSSRLDLVNQVTKSFYGLILAQDSYDVLVKSYEQAQKNFDVVNSMYELGGTSEYDKISAEVQMRSLKPAVISARNAVNIAKLRLKVLMGITADVDIIVDGSLDDYEEQMYAEILSSESYSLENNTSLRQLELSENMLNKTLKIQKMSLLPTLAMVGSYSFQSLYNDDLRFGDYSWSRSSALVMSLSVPIFRMGNYTKMRSTKLQISQLNENREYTERQLDMQVRSYLDNMKASSEQIASNKEAVAQAEKGREIAEKRYEIGKGTILELNNSEVALTQTKLTYSQSIYDFLTSKADLDKVIGKDDFLKGNFK